MTKEPFNTDTLDTFTRAYMECALWSSNDESTPAGGEPMDSNYSITDIAPDTRDEMIADCAKFQAENGALIAGDNPRLASDGESTPLSHAGHDFWLTRCGHGAGFWDGDWPVNGDALTDACKAYPNADLYIGDDGLIYA